MKNKIENLHDLFVDEGRELYYSTQQELKELPKMERKATSPELKKLIKKQREAAKNQQSQLKNAFKTINAKMESGTCEMTKSIFKRSDEMIGKSADKEVRDVAIINSLQQLSHRKIAGFGTTAAYAKEIGQKVAAKDIHAALTSEKKIDAELSRIAEKGINKKATTPMSPKAAAPTAKKATKKPVMA